MRVTITNQQTGEKATIQRDVRATHPAWVHKQLGTNSEAELQQFLDDYNVNDFYASPDGSHLGPDDVGIEMFQE